MSDVPVLPDEDDEDAIPMLIDGPQCVGFGIFVIWGDLICNICNQVMNQLPLVLMLVLMHKFNK